MWRKLDIDGEGMNNGHYAFLTLAWRVCGKRASCYFGPVDDGEGFLVATFASLLLLAMCYGAQYLILRNT
jgi:hypothetical protein